MKLTGAMIAFWLLCDPPRVPVTAERSDRGLWTLRLKHCPYCGKKHVHGGGDGPEPSGGHRASHCRDLGTRSAAGYVLVITHTVRARPLSGKAPAVKARPDEARSTAPEQARRP